MFVRDGAVPFQHMLVRGLGLHCHFSRFWLLLLITSILACPSADPVTEDDGTEGSDSRSRERDSGNNTPDEGRTDADLATADSGDLGSPDMTDTENPPVDQGINDASADLGRDTADTATPDEGSPEDISLDMAGCTPLPTTTPLVINGELDMDTSPQWNLPNTADCTVDIGGDSPALYFLYDFCNTGAGRTYDILAEGGRDDSGLTMSGVAIFIYRENGLPDDLTTCVAQTNNVGEDVALIDDFSVPSGRRFILVASSYSYVIDGTYRITITPN